MWHGDAVVLAQRSLLRHDGRQSSDVFGASVAVVSLRIGERQSNSVRSRHGACAKVNEWYFFVDFLESCISQIVLVCFRHRQRRATIAGESEQNNDVVFFLFFSIKKSLLIDVYSIFLKK